MAECNEDEESERAIFRDKTKNKTGYGSCASAASVSATGYPSPDKAEYYIKHEVKDGESLASIALRYGLKVSHLTLISAVFFKLAAICPVFNTGEILLSDLKLSCHFNATAAALLTKVLTRGASIIGIGRLTIGVGR